MSYDVQEITVQDGAPTELYDFAQGPVEWHYTSRETAFTDTAQSPNVAYTSISIERSSVESTPEKQRNALKLTVPRDFPVAELFRISPPTEVISITVRRVHRGDTSDIIVLWKGRALSCEFSGAKATLQCEPLSVSLARLGLSRVFQVACPHVLYSAACGLDKADFATVTTVAALNGLQLTVADYDPAFNYAGGFTEWVNDDGITDRRFIESTALDTASPQRLVLTLLQPYTGIAVSDPITIYPGCDHTLTTCAETFNNEANHGGFPFFPSKNPFEHPVF